MSAPDWMAWMSARLWGLSAALCRDMSRHAWACPGMPQHARSCPDLSHTISVLYCAHLCMKCSLGVSNFLEEISSLSHSVVFLYFFALITEEGFLISPCYSLELCIQSFPFLLCLLLLFFSQLSVSPPQTTILPFCISFLGDGLDHCLLCNVMNLCP